MSPSFYRNSDFKKLWSKATRRYLLKTSIRTFMNETLPPLRSYKELQSVETQGIIGEHHSAEPWISNGILAPKDNDSIRVTVDIRKVNKAIQNTNISIAKKDDIEAIMAGSDIFSKLNFKPTFLQLPLAPYSHYIIVSHGNTSLMRHKKLNMETLHRINWVQQNPWATSLQQLQTHLIYGDLMIAAPTQHAAPTLGFSFSAKYNDLGVCWAFVFEESNSFKYCYFNLVTLKQDSAKHLLWSFFVKIGISF